MTLRRIMPGETKMGRLWSLDLLRGLDMILLTVIGPFVIALNAACGLPDRVLAQFRHSWVGFSLWDIIMPLFIFVSGAAVPFAMKKRLTGGCAGWRYWRHVLGRFALLWFLGLVAQGRLMSLDLRLISPYNNTLQSIAVGYVVAAAALLIPSRKIRIALPFLLAITYSVLLHEFGDYTIKGNFAQFVENVVVSVITPSGSQVLEMADPGYTWWLTSLMFGTMALCGMEAALILSAEGNPIRKFGILFGEGACLLVMGFVLALWIPVIKPIYTLSFTVQAMGWCCLAFAVLYFLADIYVFRRGLWLIMLFGQTALLAYMAVEVFGDTLDAFARTVTQGVGGILGMEAIPVARWLVVTVLLVVVLHFRRQINNKRMMERR